MTREELKAHCEKQMEMCEMWAISKGEKPSGKIYEEHKLILELLEQEPRWIPVSERLPDTDDEVLCWYEYYHWSQGKVLPEYGLGRYLRVTSSWSGEVASGRDVRVIAWMPLPEPYKAESEGT